MRLQEIYEHLEAARITEPFNNFPNTNIIIAIHSHPIGIL